jgi:hypothetical protein
VEVTLPVVLNGQMMPGHADRYRFHASKGAHLVVVVSARELMPYISDAVPGWFQAAVTLRDAADQELASADHDQFRQDPLFDYIVPADGDYSVDIHDSIFRGREDFIYRLAIGERPWITSIFPLGGKTGGKTDVELRGWNLAKSRIRLAGGTDSVAQPHSNRVPFALDRLSETRAKSGILKREKAQRVKLPGMLNGILAAPGEAHWFSFQGRAGQEIVAEVTARRLGSPLDSTLRLTDSKGKELAFNDDFADQSAALLTHQADSFIQCKLPAKGTYYLELGDAQRHGGPAFAYRLRLSDPRPDFELRVAPSSLNIRPGVTLALTVQAVRRDGFSGNIPLSLKNVPGDFVLSGASVPAGQDRVRITITAPRNAVGLIPAAELVGKAVINDRSIEHAAVPCEEMEQAFAYHHLVAADAWMIRVFGTAGGVAWRPARAAAKLVAGRDTRVDLYVPQRLQNDIKLTLSNPPAGITIENVQPATGGVTVTLRAAADKAKPGLRGNLIFEASHDVESKGANGKQQRRRQTLGLMPALAFEVVSAGQ